MAFGLSYSEFARAESHLAFDSALGFTSNANLVQDNPDSDLIGKAGGTYRFPLADLTNRFSLRYSAYAKQIKNDIFAADLASSWSELTSGKPSKKYELGVSLRDYVNSAVGTTDQGFTHLGVMGSMKWVYAHWSYGPQMDIEIYPSDAARTDFGLLFPIDYDFPSSDSKSDLSIGLSPEILWSTTADYSKILLSLSADYDTFISETSNWGASFTVTPTFYLSRLTTATTTLLAGKKKAPPILFSSSDKESLFFLSPGVWWSKDISSDWEFRLEGLLNFQTSRSDTFNYTEAQVFASLRFRML